MAENEVIETTQEPEIDAIEALKQVRENSVSKTEYEKLKAENQKLLKSIINGETIDAPIANEPNIGELRKELYGGEGFDGTNLDFIKKSLELRNAIIERDGDEADPFLPHGREYTLQPQDYVTADKVANILQECVDIADGNSHLFTMELQRRMSPTAMDRVKK